MSLLVALFLLFTPVAHAETASSTPAEQADTAEADALAVQAEQTTQQINALKNEIDQLQIQLNNVSSQKQTLQSAIKSLDLNIQKLTKSITLTNTQITQKDREITRLSSGIATTTSTIGTTREQVAASLRNLAQVDEEPLAASLLAGGTLSDFFNQAVALGTLRDQLQNRIEDLSHLKTTLQSNKNAAEQSRAQLAALKAQLNQQKQSVAANRAAQAELLKDTQNKESSYQALIAQKRAEEAAFEQALIRLSSGLSYTFDPARIPAIGSGILRWPLDSVSITQLFGNTAFAQSGAYKGSGHNGIDFRASIGMPVRAALSGTVMEINQGAVKNCQYGKWVLVRHANGLATLYAHLSNINVSKGQGVATGQVIGLSGDTGYATGPHLHFTVYAAEAISFKQYACVLTGRVVTVPIVPLNAYLNPLNYLPSR
ncbi:MAG: peptidoglycan DD-metalloendopeptidase family protein [Patescibacteria group bacterium]